MRFMLLCAALLAMPAQAGQLFVVTEKALQNAIDDVKDRYPNLKAANQSKNPKFIDSHPKGFATGHAELDGFGVTMVAHNGTEPKVNFDKILNADDAPLNSSAWNPNLLFFEKGKTGKTKQWEIIGMGYSLAFDPTDQPFITVFGTRHDFDVHEAGYHNIVDGGFKCAEDKNLKKKAKNAGKTVDSQGRHNITRDDLKNRVNTVKHGRIWSIHIWFDPDGSGWSVGTTDPWGRQDSKAKSVPSCAFYQQR